MGRRAVVCAVVSAALALAPAAHSMAAQDPQPVSVSEAAKTLAGIRDARQAAEDQVVAAQSRVTAASDQLAIAQEAVAAAEAVNRSTKQRATEAAGDARKATDVETRANGNAREAEQALSRMARNAYINALSNSDLELFAGFATDGPEALNAFARRDMAYDNLGDASLVDAQRTVKLASEAELVATEARSVYDAAAAEFDTAHDTLAGSRRDESRAADALDTAEADVEAGQAAVRAADAKYEKAQDVYKVALQKSLAAGGGAPISSGPAADVVWSMLKKQGFSEESIAGILGNLQQESGVDPTATQSGGPGRGLAQWSQGGRWDSGDSSLISFASAQGLDPWDARTQVQFMVYEMENVLTGFDLEMFKDMTDVLAATVYFHDIYEGSADSADFVRAVRGSYALQWYARLS